MRFRGTFLVAAVLIGAVAAPVAFAEELRLDPKAIDTTGEGAKVKGKKAHQPKQQANAPAAKTGKPGGDRQFGELEGWSPGKAPPKEKEKEHDTSSGGLGNAPIGVSPSGNMSVGLPF